MSKDTELLTKLNAAVKELDAADQTVVAKAKVVGTLLLEARKVHKGLAFNEFLKKVQGLQRSRAYEIMKMVGGRKTDDEIKQAIEADRKEKRERKRKNRADKKKLPPPESETSRTDDSSTVRLGNGKSLKSLDNFSDKAKEQIAAAIGNAAPDADRRLAEFRYACNAYLRNLPPAHLNAACDIFSGCVAACGLTIKIV